MKPKAKNKPRPTRPSPQQKAAKPKANAKPKPSSANAAATSAKDPARGAAIIMPLVPEQMDVHPLLVALLSCAAFLDLSDETVVSPGPAGKVLEQIGAYFHRLSDEDIDAIGGDLAELEEHAKKARYPQELIEFIRDFLSNCGFVLEGEEDESEDGAPDSE